LWQPEEVPWLEGAEKIVVGDIGPRTDWSFALRGVDVIVHLAARVHVMRDTATDPLAEHRHVNRDGTRGLAEQAAQAGVRRLMFLSTVKVHGERSRDRAFSESDAPAPADPYAISKWEAEQALREVASRSRLETVVLRPPLVYGPGVKGNVLTLLKLCEKGVPLPIGSIRNRRSLLAVANLADAIRICAEKPEATGQTFLVRDGADLATPELVRAIARALGRPARLVPVPEPLLRTAAGFPGIGGTVGRLLDSLAVDDGKLRRMLGWVPPLAMEEALAATAAWFASRSASERRPER
jgi:nucleoside-diphosphate-sugar epimerase